MSVRDVKRKNLPRTGRRQALSAAVLSTILFAASSVNPVLAQAGNTGTAPSGAAGATHSETPAVATAEDVAALEPMEPGFTTIELAESTLEQLPMCLEYKITGITLRMVIRGWYVYFFWTPHVEHYSPDLLSMSHSELDAMPWLEFNLLLGKVYKQVSNIFFAKILTTLFKLPSTEIGGGRYLDKGWSKHQGVQFTESTVVGHPVAMLLAAFTYGDVVIPTNNRQSGGQVTEEGVQNWMTSWIDGNTAWPPLFSEILGYHQVMQLLSTSPVVQQVKQLMQQINAALASVGGRVGSSPFCPVNATPFEPYYLSGLDSYAWRLGYPMADPDKSLTIMNPFSGDKIAPSTETDVGKVLFNLPPEVVKFLKPRWGHTFPREGALDQPDTSKHGAVVAERSRSLLAESKKPMNRIYRIPAYAMNGAAWSKLHPKKTMCHRNIANTGADLEKHSRYAWTLWTSHDCDLERRGIPIVTVPIGPIYVTPAIPE